MAKPEVRKKMKPGSFSLSGQQLHVSRDAPDWVAAVVWTLFSKLELAHNH